MISEIRVRIAPSPTGDPHVGTAYTALFNYVFAKKHGGKFILRIEDTDQTRAKASSEEQILKTLKWLGLDWDEGPDCGGPHGPYRQSERLPLYRDHCDTLIQNGTAYYCFCTSARLDALREEQKSQGLTTRYDGNCRELSNQEVTSKLASGIPYVVRLKVPRDGQTKFVDHLRGELEFENERIDDQVLLKTDGFPTYHLANVVDDHLMKISHVIRAEEWISSTPKHVLLYQAFGWNAPVFCHLPLLRNADRSKISKRKNPVSLTYYRRAGFLPEALLNFLGLMGWSYGEDREIFQLNEMIEVFDLKRISLGGPVFDLVKLTWLNQHYMHRMDEEDFVRHLRSEVFSDEYLRQLKPLVLERMSRFEQFVDNNYFFFNGALDYSHVSVLPQGREKSEVVAILSSFLELLDELYEWNSKAIHDLMNNHRAAIGWKPKDYFMTIRMIVTGRKDSPPLAESMEVIGREIVRFRIRDFLTKIRE